mmetsp:Transcript_13072/g.54756  ORF Transcript_13072/g.54756 Transcript_13072/m.54756 type:complete len:208 (-) Transcript_13072:1702-2325(-)
MCLPANFGDAFHDNVGRREGSGSIADARAALGLGQVEIRLRGRRVVEGEHGWPVVRVCHHRGGCGRTSSFVARRDNDADWLAGVAQILRSEQRLAAAHCVGIPHFPDCIGVEKCHNALRGERDGRVHAGQVGARDGAQHKRTEQAASCHRLVAAVDRPAACLESRGQLRHGQTDGRCRRVGGARPLDGTAPRLAFGRASCCGKSRRQ